MTASVWMLELGRTGWRLHACRDDAAPTNVAQEFPKSELLAQSELIHDGLEANGYRGEPILVALESGWCLTATLAVNRHAELRDRQTMLYRFEECIPWSAEECVGDYSRAGNKALMVAAPTVPLTEFFSRLESLGVQIQSIVPLALLACAEHMDRGGWPAEHLVAFELDGWIDLISVAANSPITWSTIPARGKGLSHELKRAAMESGTAAALVGYGLDEAAVTNIQTCGAAHVIESTQPADNYSALALAAAAKNVEGRLEVPIELKRGAFGRSRGHVALRRYALVFQAAVAVLIVAVMGVLLHRGYMAGRQADLLATKQVEVFRGIFPNTKVPIGVKSRLESELAKLKGLQGGDATLPDGVSAIAMLHDMLAALPTDRRFLILEIRIEEGRINIDGEVREHGDAEAIAQRLRSGRFEVASPRTQRLDDKRVSLRITGTRTQ